jgi:hypothetical protein
VIWISDFFILFEFCALDLFINEVEFSLKLGHRQTDLPLLFLLNGDFHIHLRMKNEVSHYIVRILRCFSLLWFPCTFFYSSHFVVIFIYRLNIQKCPEPLWLRNMLDDCEPRCRAEK